MIGEVDVKEAAALRADPKIGSLGKLVQQGEAKGGGNSHLRYHMTG